MGVPSLAQQMDPGQGISKIFAESSSIEEDGRSVAENLYSSSDVSRPHDVHLDADMGSKINDVRLIKIYNFILPQTIVLSPV